MEVVEKVTGWLTHNWVIVALVVSEVAAVLPLKAKGILHFALKLGNAIFKQSSKSQKIGRS
jgi:hypothetical protein